MFKKFVKEPTALFYLDTNMMLKHIMVIKFANF